MAAGELDFEAMVGAPKRLPYTDLIRAVPEHLRAEVIAGKLVVSPRPAVRHVHAASVLGTLINAPFGLAINGPGGWWIEHEPELHLGIDDDYDVLIPDLAGWRKEDVPELPDAAFMSVVPSWVCEILSPSTAAIDRAEKMPFYARAGVQHLWLVDAAIHTLEVYTLKGDSWFLTNTARGARTIRAEPFALIELDLAPLWTKL